jgi:tetratricopeptide (TPR) repeat protein
MSRPSTDRFRRRSILYAAVGLSATIPYLNSLGGAFVFDDLAIVRDNPLVQSGSAVAIVTTPEYLAEGYYRPLTLLSHAANAHLWPSPTGYHVVNIALHGLASLLVLRLALLLLDSTLAAAAAALLFAVHPIHTEAVSSIVGRAEVLSTLLVIASVLAFLSSLGREGSPRGLFLALSAAALGLAVFAKEGALAGIGLAAVAGYWVSPRMARGRVLLDLLPLLLVAAAYLGLRWILIGSIGMPHVPGLLDNPLAHVTILPRLMTATVILWEYVSLLIFPVHLSADYSFNQVPVVLSVFDPHFLIAAVASTAVLVATLLLARSFPELLVALLFFVMPLSLTANFLFPIGTIKAERLLYLPSLGWCLALGCLIAAAARRRPALSILTCAALIAAYGGRTWVRNRDWRDELALFKGAVAAAPGSAKAHHNLAVQYEHRGELEVARAHYRRSLRIFPEYAAAAAGIGVTYELEGDATPALHWYQEATRLDWDSAKVHLQVGTAWKQLEYYDTAEAAFRTGLASDPESPHLLVSLASLRLDQGDFWEAVELLERLDRLGPLAGKVAETVAAVRNEIDQRMR